ncbi:hypothetical protein [Methylomonas rapida]|uniref:Uncharacterized protein n=1 Tax=Methylomonas rapida TaxID=2963939 RepID=A0ABY7GGY4_9GAMM|nr:hypothetical protein [Methylomonas rapida]WAR43268.1 hypothetical protein NM686_012800 [Methylomonas rapida]
MKSTDYRESSYLHSDSQNITSINTRSYVETDRSNGTLAKVSGQLGDINLAQDTFYSQFADSLDTCAVADLSGMQACSERSRRCAGQVRSRREAATLSPLLALLLPDLTAADRTGQQALMDPIIKVRSDTSTLVTTFTGAYDSHNLTVNIQGITACNDAYNALASKLTILERFNDRIFNAAPDGTAAANESTWRRQREKQNASIKNMTCFYIPESVTPHIARPFIRHTLPKFAEFKSVVQAIEFNG